MLCSAESDLGSGPAAVAKGVVVGRTGIHFPIDAVVIAWAHAGHGGGQEDVVVAAGARGSVVVKAHRVVNV